MIKKCYCVYCEVYIMLLFCISNIERNKLIIILIKLFLLFYFYILQIWINFFLIFKIIIRLRYI